MCQQFFRNPAHNAEGCAARAVFRGAKKAGSLRCAVLHLCSQALVEIRVIFFQGDGLSRRVGEAVLGGAGADKDALGVDHLIGDPKADAVEAATWTEIRISSSNRVGRR